jgi:predicted metalloprotease with PDZ domain
MLPTMQTKTGFSSLFASIAFLFTASALGQTTPAKLDVDATDAPRNILHAQLHIPASPGKLTLFYPKWLPGEHSPDGPITDLVGLKMSAGGKTVDWQRDAQDMFAFHVEVPAGADALDIALDFLLPASEGAFSAGPSSTAKLLDLSWNEVLLYPQRTNPFAMQYTASVRLPDGWKFGTALPVADASGGKAQFAPVSLETLVDSPLIAGEYFRTFELASVVNTPHGLHVVADSVAALDAKPEIIRSVSHLVAEENALFGAHHYRSYHFLLTLSERVAHFGLEHHESSDDRVGEKYLVDDDAFKTGADLLSHEMVHSWNGKYRRPAGLNTPDFQQPMQGELLWVYEGLTEYLGALLAARSGLWTNEDFREEVAYTAATLDRQAGRQWRPLSDTTIAAQLLYHADPEAAARRRKTDFYPEGELIWLEADTIIRQQSQGKLSLDDFCRKFHGGASGPPKVVPYTLSDVVVTLNGIAPYDWGEFFRKRVYQINPHVPLGGIENSGWRLAYTNTVPAMLKARESLRKFTDMSFSLGLVLKEDGYIADVLPGSPADKEQVGVAMKLVAVNGRRWTPEILRGAVKAAATNHAPIELLIENSEYFKTYHLTYSDGEKYPCLERDPSKPDLLSQILQPLTPEPAMTVDRK